MTNCATSEKADLTWWYWLSSVSGLGPAYTRTLVDAFGGPRQVFEATPAELEHAVKLPARTLNALETSKSRLSRFESIAGRQLRTAAAMGARILTLNDPEYPEFLKAQPKQAPPLLHVQGDLKLIRPRSVAVVGTRSPSRQAIDSVHKISARLCNNGHSVVAGMARGIDTAAHQGALQSSGATIGVLGCGLDHIYPPENAPLYVEARQRGLLVSQFPFGAPPSPSNLRQRNKLIVALVEAVVVAESDVNGGAMIAARSALEQGRNLFAMEWDDMEFATRAGTSRLLESNLARPIHDGAEELVFDDPLFPGSGPTVAKVWRAAFPVSPTEKGADDPGRSGTDRSTSVRRTTRAKAARTATR